MPRIGARINRYCWSETSQQALNNEKTGETLSESDRGIVRLLMVARSGGNATSDALKVGLDRCGGGCAMRSAGQIRASLQRAEQDENGENVVLYFSGDDPEDEICSLPTRWVRVEDIKGESRHGGE